MHPTAREAAGLFIQLVVRAHGLPRKVISDRGTQFKSELWMDVMGRLGTRVALATTHHPQTNGLTERMNRTLIQLIRKVCAKEKEKWVEALPLLEFAYNNSPHRTTGITPFRANQGSDPHVPASLLIPANPSSSSVKAYAEQVEQRLRRMWTYMQDRETREQAQVKSREDAKWAKPGRVSEGDEVLCRRFPAALGKLGHPKTELRYDGPYRVKRMIKDSVAELEGVPKGSPTAFNVEYLKVYRRDGEAAPFRQRTPPPPPSGESRDQWEVERILDDRGVGRGQQFLVKWTGYPTATWEPRRNLTGCQEALREYRRSRGEDRRPA